jgi:hypothetical protein
MKQEPEKKSTSMAEMARKLLLTGIGAVFMTEESIRKSLGDMKMPKDAVGYLLDTVRKQKDDLLELVGNEVNNFLSKIRVHEELQKALTGMQLHVDAKINFDKKSRTGVAGSKLSIKKNS